MITEIEEKSRSTKWATEEKLSNDRTWSQHVEIATIYFGGGTPSLMEAFEVERILTALRKNFKVDPQAEISMECNPESLDLKKIQQYQTMGITRLTLGIQSLNKKTLFRIARPHDAETINQAIEAMKQAKFPNIGADFIIGLPYQTLKEFKEQTERMIDLKIPHLSYYFLSYDTKKIDLFKADCPNDETQIKMYNSLTRQLKKAGYRHYEVSNYALPGYESKHNLRYWNQEEYLGLGLGAHSYLRNETAGLPVSKNSLSFCSENERNFEAYLKNPLSIHEITPIDAELHELEYLMLHLRTDEGIDLNEYQSKFGKREELLEKSLPFLESGHLKKSSNRLHATEKGFLILEKVTEGVL